LQVEPHLRPREHPGYGAKVVEAASAGSSLRPGGYAQPAQLVDRAHLREPLLKAFSLNQLSISGSGRFVDPRREAAEALGRRP
jgi:hypothetical protein